MIKEEEEMISTAIARAEELLVKPPHPWELEFGRFIGAVKLALIGEAWIEEKSEEEILEKFGIAPGDLRAYVSNLEWVIYSMKEVLKIRGIRSRELSKLVLRIRHGVREDLLELVKLPGIGRIRARKLKNAGIDAENIAKVGIEKLAGIVGRKTAEKVIKALGVRGK